MAWGLDVNNQKPQECNSLNANWCTGESWKPAPHLKSPTPDLASRHSSRHSTSRYHACQLVLDSSHSTCTCISLIRTAAQICVQLQIMQVISSAVQVPLEALGGTNGWHTACCVQDVPTYLATPYSSGSNGEWYTVRLLCMYRAYKQKNSYALLTPFSSPHMSVCTSYALCGPP